MRRYELLSHAAFAAVLMLPVKLCIAQEPAEQLLSDIIVKATTPLPGIGLPLRDVAANLQNIKGEEIEQRNAANITEYMEQNLGSVTINSVQGNPYQPDVSYRGFTASPLLGTPQGLSVFQDGVRINEPFGDVVNWDLLPQSAIANLQLMPGSNPLFGLNTLGGAIAIATKSGRSNPGGQIEVSGGSFGRKTIEFEQGGVHDYLDYFVTVNDATDKGWAEHNPSRVKQLFGKVGYQDGDTSVNLSLTAADNTLQGSQTLPRSFLENPRQAYTFPDQNLNKVLFWNLSGSHFYGENLQLTANSYYRSYNNNSTSSNVNPPQIPAVPQALNARSTIDQDSYGMGLQLSYTGKLFAMNNQFVAGVSGDFADSKYRNFSQDAHFTDSRNTIGDGLFLLQTDAKTYNGNIGVFFSDTLSLNPQWSVTGSGRFNDARVTITDQTGLQPLLDGAHQFKRFNPGLGATYNPVAGLTLFSNYNEGMRAPTAIELACADPGAPCSLPNSFIADPALKPVIAKTTEFGARGKYGEKSSWSASIYRTALDNDIEFISSGSASTGYFQNIGKARRQGIELAANTAIDKLGVSIRYSYIEATYQTAFIEQSGSNSKADVNGNISVMPGNKMPGVPQNTFKLALDYVINANWEIGANLAYRSAIYARGDENNQDSNGKIAGYTLANLDTSYELSKKLNLFARVDNLFNRKYANFGLLGQDFFTGPAHTFDAANVVNEQFIAVGAPRGIWAGLKYSW